MHCHYVYWNLWCILPLLLWIIMGLIYCFIDFVERSSMWCLVNHDFIFFVQTQRKNLIVCKLRTQKVYALSDVQWLFWIARIPCLLKMLHIYDGYLLDEVSFSSKKLVPCCVFELLKLLLQNWISNPFISLKVIFG